MIKNKYTTDDLLQLTKLGRFGNSEMNALAASAFILLKKLQLENVALREKIEDKRIEIFQVPRNDDKPDINEK